MIFEWFAQIEHSLKMVMIFDGVAFNCSMMNCEHMYILCVPIEVQCRPKTIECKFFNFRFGNNMLVDDMRICDNWWILDV